MKSPFQFGKVVTGNSFTNRREEIERLTSNFLNGVNTVIISPRRWGKSSLIKQTANLLTESNNRVKFCCVDLFTIRSENEFYSRLSEGTAKATFTKVEEWIRATKTFFRQIRPKITIGTDEFSEFNISFDRMDVNKHPEEILNFPELVAKEKGVRLVVCIDEFQNMSFHHNPAGFQKLLRSVWQHHDHVVYILYGSKRHMMGDIFNHPGAPFYRFGDMMVLDKIPESDLVQFIMDAFSRTKKMISKDQARDIVRFTEHHPYYSQQLAHLVWIRVDRITADGEIEKAAEDILDQNSVVYQREVENSSMTQINFLCALAEGVTEMSSKQTLAKYYLGTSANVVKIKQSLMKREIIDIFDGKTSFMDPIFKKWVIREFKLKR